MIQCSAEKALNTWLLESLSTSSADQVSVLSQQLQSELVFPRLQPQGRNARTPSVEIRCWTWGSWGGDRTARRCHGCGGRCGQQSSSMLIVVSYRVRTRQLGALCRRYVGEKTLKRAGSCSWTIREVTETGRKKWGRRPSVVGAWEMMWCWVVTEVAPRQHGARWQRWVPATDAEGSGQSCGIRTFERFPETKPEMRKGVGQRGRHNCRGWCRSSWTHVRVVRMSLRADLFLFSPFGSPVLEPHLKHKKFTCWSCVRVYKNMSRLLYHHSAWLEQLINLLGSRSYN